MPLTGLFPAPKENVKFGPLKQQPPQVPKLSSDQIQLTLRFGAVNLKGDANGDETGPENNFNNELLEANAYDLQLIERIKERQNQNQNAQQKGGSKTRSGSKSKTANDTYEIIDEIGPNKIPFPTDYQHLEHDIIAERNQNAKLKGKIHWYIEREEILNQEVVSAQIQKEIDRDMENEKNKNKRTSTRLSQSNSQQSQKLSNNQNSDNTHSNTDQIPGPGKNHLPRYKYRILMKWRISGLEPMCFYAIRLDLDSMRQILGLESLNTQNQIQNLSNEMPESADSGTFNMSYPNFNFGSMSMTASSFLNKGTMSSQDGTGSKSLNTSAIINIPGSATCSKISYSVFNNPFSPLSPMYQQSQNESNTNNIDNTTVQQVLNANDYINNPLVNAFSLLTRNPTKHMSTKRVDPFGISQGESMIEIGAEEFEEICCGQQQTQSQSDSFELITELKKLMQSGYVSGEGPRYRFNLMKLHCEQVEVIPIEQSGAQTSKSLPTVSEGVEENQNQTESTTYIPQTQSQNVPCHRILRRNLELPRATGFLAPGDSLHGAWKKMEQDWGVPLRKKTEKMAKQMEIDSIRKELIEKNYGGVTGSNPNLNTFMESQANSGLNTNVNGTGPNFLNNLNPGNWQKLASDNESPKANITDDLDATTVAPSSPDHNQSNINHNDISTDDIEVPNDPYTQGYIKFPNTNTNVTGVLHGYNLTEQQQFRTNMPLIERKEYILNDPNYQKMSNTSGKVDENGNKIPNPTITRWSLKPEDKERLGMGNQIRSPRSMSPDGPGHGSQSSCSPVVTIQDLALLKQQHDLILQEEKEKQAEKRRLLMEQQKEKDERRQKQMEELMKKNPKYLNGEMPEVNKLRVKYEEGERRSFKSPGPGRGGFEESVGV